MMNGVSLPPIAGATTSGSRPSSSSSTASTSYTIVPRVYYTQHNVYRRAANANPVPRAPSRLPALHQSHHRGKGHPLYEVRSRFSAKYRRASGVECRLSANSPFLPKTGTEDCLKCLMKVPHKKCASHKYIRIGGGYRHGYWYVKCLLEEIELQRQRELIKQRRLEAIKENKVRAIKTYIRTKSGRLVEKIVFLSEEDYEAFKAGKDVKSILNKYLSKDEAKGLQSWDKDEVKAVKTLVRTKSGRLIEKLVYVSKEDYDAIKEGKKDAKEILKNYVNTEDGEVEGWEEAKMKTIKTFVRTKSGRLIEKTIMISQEDYDAMIKDGKDPNEIIKKYIQMEDGEQLESWQSAEPMKAIKTVIRTKSGRLIEKTLMVSADDYDKMMKAGGNPNDILKKYMTEEDGEIESWEKAPDGRPMKVVKTTIRTKSGRLIEKTVLMTEDEFKEFQASGGNPEFLKRFIDLEQGEEIEDWEKASTVYSAASDEEVKKAKPGQRIVGKDGSVYEVVVDPITGKKYKKKLNQNESDVDSGIASMKRGRGRKKKGGAGGLDGEEEEETAVERSRRKAGKRNEDSDSEYSYKSYKSDGGTRHVTRRRKRADGTYSAAESYHSDQDEEGQARRRQRRRERDHANSAHSYYSVVSEGGTRHTRRRRKRADGTYSASESYHSSDSDLPGGGLAAKNKKKNRREHGSDSEHSYYSEVSVGGTHHRKRKKKIKDKHGKVIGYAASEPYTSDDERRKKDKAERAKRGSMGGDGRKPKSMVSYEKGSRRDVVDPIKKEGAKDGTGGGKKKGKRDGNEADDESDDEGLDATGKKKKKGKHRPKSGESEYEYEYDDKGRVIKKKRKKLVDGESGSEYEYEYDADGNLKAVKKLDSAEKERRKKDDGDYFEVDEAGMVKLKAGRKKIDISRLTADALKKLGIDPNASKEEIARKLKEMFGDDILITDKDRKIGTKHLAEYGSDVDTDELANDSDLDISELTGTRRVNVLMRRGGQEIIDHMKKVLELSKLRDDYAKDLDERDGDIDFLSHYRLVDSGKLESYARAFVVEDNDRDIVLSNSESRIALGGVPSLQEITPKELEYVLKVLKIDDASQITFRMFAVISALSERVTKMDPLSKHLLEICDLLDIQRKMELYRSMFYCNANSDRDPNYIKCESLKIELIAGGLNWKQQQFIMERLQPNYLNEISFLDYICYIPLFLSMHENICDNPLDMSDNKYESMMRKPSGGPRQRDMNPLGFPLKKDSSFQMKQQAKDLLTGKVSIEDVKSEKRNLLQRYAKLPQLIESEPGPTSRESTLSSFNQHSARNHNQQS